jgi:hypothetical protein
MLTAPQDAPPQDAPPQPPQPPQKATPDADTIRSAAPLTSPRRKTCGVLRIRPGTVRPYRFPCEPAGQSRRAGRFLAERYLPATTREALASIRHSQTIYVPADETCFTLFEAASPDQVTETSDRFGLGYRRVVAAITLDSPELTDQPYSRRLPCP